MAGRQRLAQLQADSSQQLRVGPLHVHVARTQTLRRARAGGQGEREEGAGGAAAAGAGQQQGADGAVRPLHGVRGRWGEAVREGLQVLGAQAGTLHSHPSCSLPSSAQASQELLPAAVASRLQFLAGSLLLGASLCGAGQCNQRPALCGSQHAHHAPMQHSCAGAVQGCGGPRRLLAAGGPSGRLAADLARPAGMDVPASVAPAAGAAAARPPVCHQRQACTRSVAAGTRSGRA